MYEEYKYLYETHLHTNEGSACGRNSGLEMAKSAKDFGYTGIFVTEHNWGGNTSVDRSLPWEEWIERSSEGFRNALAYGKEHDLDVFYGMEAAERGTEFLLYGLTPEWMKQHPEIHEVPFTKIPEIVQQAGGFVVQAHPFREERYIPEIRLFPELVDAVEGINATHSNRRSTGHANPAWNDKAIKYAAENHLPITAGSDIHAVTHYGGGVLFKERLKDASDYRRLILAGDYLLTDGDTLYDHVGNVLGPRE